MIYRIAKWNETFERAESRKLKSLTWVAMPVGFQSHGFQSLLDEFGDSAPAIYGAWCALVSYAASCHVRGLLANGQGQPRPVSHISRATGFPHEVFDRLIEWASRPNVRWLEVVQPEEIAANSISGDSPDEPPTSQKKTPITQPNLTQPYPTEQDITPPNQTKPCSVGGSVGDELLTPDQDEVRQQCSKLDNALLKTRKNSMTTDEIWKLGWISQQLTPGLLSEVATKVRSNEVAKPKPYIEKALRRICDERGLDFHLLKANVPPRQKLVSSEVSSDHC